MAGGHRARDAVAYAPIEPQTGDDGRVLHDLVTHYANDGMGQDFDEAFYLTGRTMQLLVLILFDASSEESIDRTFTQTAQMIDETASFRYGGYRAHTAFMAHIASRTDFDGGAALRLCERIKDALDPKGTSRPASRTFGPSATGMRAAP